MSWDTGTRDSVLGLFLDCTRWCSEDLVPPTVPRANLVSEVSLKPGPEDPPALADLSSEPSENPALRDNSSHSAAQAASVISTMTFLWCGCYPKGPGAVPGVGLNSLGTGVGVNTTQWEGVSTVTASSQSTCSPNCLLVDGTEDLNLWAEPRLSSFYEWADLLCFFLGTIEICF